MLSVRSLGAAGATSPPRGRARLAARDLHRAAHRQRYRGGRAVPRRGDAGTSGIGWYIVDAWGRIDYPAMFAGIIAMGLLGVVLYEALDALESWATRWRRAGR